jgi:AcrR family transcriptional regulator
MAEELPGRSEPCPGPQPAEGRKYAGKSPDVRRAERRQRLLDAGLQLYGTEGYASTTIAQLCHTAGVAPSKFYEEFTGREELLSELCLDIVTDVNSAMVSAVASEVTLSGQALAGLSAFCHTLLDDPRRARTLLVESVGVSAELESHRRSHMDQTTTLLIDYVRALAETNGVPFIEGRRLHTVVRALVGGVGEVVVDWFSDPDPPRLDDVIDDLAGMFVALGTWLDVGGTAAVPGAG